MPYICYRRTNEEPKPLCCSGTVPEGYTGEDEILTNVIPYYGGSSSDYGFVEISDEEERARIGREIQFIFGDDGLPIGIHLI